ncbi:MAG TPA: glycosyltransferase [Pirellulaceae bacterium]|jgi:glycosyltransferase involved in cell wall biosynthesis
MRILMLTNTYPPVMSGVARSIVAFDREYRRRNHETLIIAPESDESTHDDPHVVRVPAIQHFNGNEFPIPVPAPGLVAATADEFRPDIIHAHHPFFMGNTALRLAKSRDVPLVFTHHTMYDQYTHYTAVETPTTSRFIGALTSGYADLCDAVIAPSRDVATMLRKRGVHRRIEIIPTGVDVVRFSRGDGASFRARHGIPADAFVIGYVGRLAPEKNLDFLASSVARFMAVERRAHFLVVGSGPCDHDIRKTMADQQLTSRLHLVGRCQGQDLIDAFHAMDVFAFASQTETQGMVLTEAMAADKPVVALSGPGVRDVVRDRANGRLVSLAHRQLFAQALAWIAVRTSRERLMLSAAARRTAERFSMRRQTRRALDLYESLINARQQDEPSIWSRVQHRLEAELTLWSNVAQAANRALDPEPSPSESQEAEEAHVRS